MLVNLPEVGIAFRVLRLDMGRPGEGEEPSQKRARSAQHEEGADEVVIERVIFRASVRPHNWGRSKGPPDAGAGGAWSEPKETAFPPVKLRMTGISRDQVPAIAKKAVVRNYPSWACVECTYQHEQVNGEAWRRQPQTRNTHVRTAPGTPLMPLPRRRRRLRRRPSWRRAHLTACRSTRAP